jgi:hypothetical protein
MTRRFTALHPLARNLRLLGGLVELGHYAVPAMMHSIIITYEAQRAIVVALPNPALIDPMERHLRHTATVRCDNVGDWILTGLAS